MAVETTTVEVAVLEAVVSVVVAAELLAEASLVVAVRLLKGNN